MQVTNGKNKNTTPTKFRVIESCCPHKKKQKTCNRVQTDIDKISLTKALLAISSKSNRRKTSCNMMPGYSPYLLSELKPIISRDSLKFVTFACNNKKTAKVEKLWILNGHQQAACIECLWGVKKKSGATSTHWINIIFYLGVPFGPNWAIRITLTANKVAWPTWTGKSLGRKRCHWLVWQKTDAWHTRFRGCLDWNGILTWYRNLIAW